MRLSHHDLSIVLEDEWLAEAQMAGFSPTSNAYRTDLSFSINWEPILEVRIADVGPVGPVRCSIGIFRDSEDGVPARERVVKILRGFRLGEAIPPVQIVGWGADSQYPYKLTAGVDRVCGSLGAGFAHVPTLWGFDWNA